MMCNWLPISLGAGMDHKKPGFELIDQERVKMGRIPLVRLEMRSRGFKAWILHFVSALGTLITLLDQNLEAIDR
ncbi:hypothetical protein Tco_1041918 [Tanacetum coccineum]|uniref:Uncharacterized protein n=1 Tax=Tanacetum coccineum TaxID=301880 RepID=A0ABQ5GHJ2_9ASTR